MTFWKEVARLGFISCCTTTKVSSISKSLKTTPYTTHLVVLLKLSKLILVLHFLPTLLPLQKSWIFGPTSPFVLFRLTQRFSARHMSGTHFSKTERQVCSSTQPQAENHDPHVIPIPAVLGQELSHSRRSIKKMTSFRDLKVVSSSRRITNPPETCVEEASSIPGSNSSSPTRATSKPFATISHVIHWIRDSKKHNPKKGIPEESTNCNLGRTPSRIRSGTLPSPRSPDMGVKSRNEYHPQHARRQSQVGVIESHLTGFKPDHRRLSYDKMPEEKVTPSKSQNTDENPTISCQFQSYKQDPDNRSSFETLDGNIDFEYDDDTIQLPKWPDCHDS
ncbi:uncharacterized protein MELLADRAFT_64912 [Melampsora larici-populina 98AG31]|uniref:Uncharacterized protein n=1 Tax=Melampsora larici-populina (strain 98AG31 / pathotype 3-4-7) TaxID=747676 RepID=F4RT92_MELLP|nr:uncharacterized protein MELLADRAFT_64912 [Melampsora larici-populina 98AG31]EGG04468.1 hypothetical protein MELLADRAFT_64912 [Melampsora larici-populina 98AG31]